MAQLSAFRRQLTALMAEALSISENKKREKVVATRSKKVQNKELHLAIANGLTRFVYEDGVVVYAINKRNADKKHEKHLKSL